MGGENALSRLPRHSESKDVLMYLFDREKMRKSAWIKNQASCQRRLGRSDSGNAQVMMMWKNQMQRVGNEERET